MRSLSRIYYGTWFSNIFSPIMSLYYLFTGLASNVPGTRFIYQVLVLLVLLKEKQEKEEIQRRESQSK